MADVAVALEPSRDNLLAARHIHAALAEPPANRRRRLFVPRSGPMNWTSSSRVWPGWKPAVSGV